ncbi:MAG: hypothetical protein ICV72_15420 [Aldersonia sp.]|nr:hypothetical protein [Aldersonia sp.]
MLESNGPLPPEIYRRRRWLAIGVAFVVLVLLLWLVLSLRGGGSDDPAAAGVSSSLTSTSTTTSTSTSATSSVSGTASGSATGTTTSGTSATSGNASPVAATPSGQCADSSLAVKATIAQPTYPAGQQPEFGIVITNISTTACERDLGAGLQQVLVYSLDGSQRLWANSDCFPSATPDVRTLNPGQQAAFTVKWSGTTSQPGCAGERVAVGPGAYAVVAQLGALRSGPEPFNLA